MARTLAQIKRYRSRFGWIFLVSIAILFVSNMVWLAAPMSNAPLPPQPSPSPSPSPLPAPDTISLAMLISVASLLASLTSLLGFFFTTAVAWRKERREQAHADVELEKKKLEIEKLRLELGQNRVQAPATGGKSDDVA